MKKKIISTVFCIAMLAVLGACATKSEGEKTADTKKEAVKTETKVTDKNKSSKKKAKKQTASDLKKAASAEQSKQEKNSQAAAEQSRADKPVDNNAADSGSQTAQKPAEQKPAAPAPKPEQPGKPAEPAKPAPAPTPEPPKEPTPPPHVHDWQPHTATRPIEGPYGTYRTDTWEQIDHLIAAAAEEYYALSPEEQAIAPLSRYIAMKCPWGTFTGTPVIGEETYTDYYYCSCGATQ